MKTIYVTLTRLSEDKEMGMKASEWNIAYADTDKKKAYEYKARAEKSAKELGLRQDYKIEEVKLFD